MKTKLKRAYEFLRDTIQKWNFDKGPRWAAAVAFYTAFSLGPLLLIGIWVATMIFGDDARGEITNQLQSLMGEQGASAVSELLKATAEREGSGIIAATIGVGLLLFTASRVFLGLQDALNWIFRVDGDPDIGWKVVAKKRGLAFGMVLGVIFCLLVSLIASAILNHAMEGASAWLALPDWVAQLTDLGVSLLFVTLLFALLFKFVPDVRLSWRQVAGGAFLTALLFVAGKFAIGYYLGQRADDSAYGAAGAFVILLLWIYYSAQIFLFGAEVVCCAAKARGHFPEPESMAARVERRVVRPGTAESESPA